MKRVLFSTSGLFAILGTSPGVWAQPQDGEYYYGPHMWDGGWWMLGGPLMMIVFIAAVVVVVILLVRWLGGPSHRTAPYPPSGKTPFDILKDRFARGEIDGDEFEERKRVLDS